MSAKSPVEFERGENGRIKAIDKETGKSGIGETEKDALTNLVKTLDSLEDIQRVIVSFGQLQKIAAFLEDIRPVIVDNPENVDLKQDDEGHWVATDTERGISSGPMDDWADAIDDLEENIALEEGDLELSEETKRSLGATDDELERGETISHKDLKQELDL